MPLTDKAIKALKPGPKALKVADGSGLFLQVNPNGSKWWRLRFFFGGAEKMISLGTYPDTGLALAREKRDDARRLLARGINPSAQRYAERAALAFGAGDAEAVGCIGKTSPLFLTAGNLI